MIGNNIIVHILRVSDDTCFQIVRCEDPRHAAIEAVGIHMGHDPGVLFHVQKCLGIGITAVWKNRDEQIRRDSFSCIGIYDPHRVAGPIHLHGLAGLVLQMHCGFGLVNILSVILVELCGLVRKLSVGAAFLAILYPQQTQRDTALLHLPVYFFVVRNPVLRVIISRRKQMLPDSFCTHVFGFMPG